MGGEIARLKNENRRTKTSIQRMKSYHQQRKLKSMIRAEQFDEEGRRAHSSGGSQNDSDRMIYRPGVNFS